MRFSGFEIGGAEAECAPPSISCNNFSAPSMISAEQCVCCREVAVPKPLSDFGAGYGEFAFDVGRDVLDAEAKSLPAGPQQFHIAFAACSESVVVSNDDGRGAEAFDEHIADKIFWLEARKCAAKGLYDQVIETSFCQTGCALVHGLDQFQSAGIAKEHLAWMGIKSEHGGLGLLFFGFVDHPFEQRLVAQMNAVKGAGGHNAPLAGRKVGKSSVNAHCC